MNNVYCACWAMLMLAVSPFAVGFPLSTEDTGTLGQGRSKVEMTAEWGEERESGSSEVSVTNELSMAHGLRDDLNSFLPCLTVKFVPMQQVSANRSVASVMSSSV